MNNTNDGTAQDVASGALLAFSRDDLGRIVREEWIAWAQDQPTPKASWLVPWDQLSEPDKEVDRRIGERLFEMGWYARVHPHFAFSVTAWDERDHLRAAALIANNAPEEKERFVGRQMILICERAFSSANPRG